MIIYKPFSHSYIFIARNVECDVVLNVVMVTSCVPEFTLVLLTLNTVVPLLKHKNMQTAKVKITIVFNIWKRDLQLCARLRGIPISEYLVLKLLL